MDRLNKYIGLGLIFLGLGNVYAGTQPKFLIIPTTKTTFSVPVGFTPSVVYKITNKTKIRRTLTMQAIPYVSQQIRGTNPCSKPSFILGPQQSCNLVLDINSTNLPTTGIHQLPKICKTKGTGDNSPDPFLCSQTSVANGLNITTAAAIGRLLTAGAAAVDVFSFGAAVPITYNSTDGGLHWGALNLLTVPPGATRAVLSGTACDDNGLRCIAVGSATIAGLGIPLTYLSTDGGMTWGAPQLLAVPPTKIRASLSAVSCNASAMNCIAVGISASAPAAATNVPMVYITTNGGVSWQLSSTQPPPLVGKTNSKLTGIACSNSGVSCVAVGGATELPAFNSLPLSYITTDAGDTWTASIQATPPPGTNFNLFRTVACSSSGIKCLGVGVSADPITGNGTPLSYTSIDGGFSWVASTSQPTGLPGSDNTEPYNVTCNSTGLLCTAVGVSQDAAGETFSFNMAYKTTDGGISWQNPVFPATDVGEGNSLNGVICDSAGIYCVAVGSNQQGNNVVSYSFNSSDGGSSWTGPFYLPVGSSYPSVNVGPIAGNL